MVDLARLSYQNRRESWKISMTGKNVRVTDPTGFPHQMEKLREAKVLMFLKAKTSIESESPVKRGTAQRRQNADDGKAPLDGIPPLPPVITTDASLYLFSSEIENKQGFLQK